MNIKPKFQRSARPDHTCKDEVALIADYLAGRLNPKFLAAFEKHLGQCPDCTAFLNTYKKTIDATKSFLKFQLLNIPPKLKLPPNGENYSPYLCSGCIFYLQRLSNDMMNWDSSYPLIVKF